MRRSPFALMLAAGIFAACAGSRPRAARIEEPTASPIVASLPGANDALDGIRVDVDFCLAKAQDDDPDASGIVRVRLIINADGTVSSAEVDAGEHTHPDSLATCVGQAALRTRFPKPPSAPFETTLVAIMQPGAKTTELRLDGVEASCRSFVAPAPPPRPLASAAPSVAAAPAPSASASEPTVPGADAVVAKNKWRFRGCYNKTLQRDADAGGTVSVEVSIDASGKVTSARPLDGGHCPRSLGTCVAGTFYSMSGFPAPNGGKATFTVKAVFANHP